MMIPFDHFLVEVTSKTNETFKGPTMEWYRDTTLGNKEWYKKTTGTVLQAPQQFTDRPTKCAKTKGEMYLHSDMVNCPIQPGDTVYFDYLAINETKRFAPNLQYFILADDIFAYERNGELHAQTGRVILSPINIEEWEQVTGNDTESPITIPKAFRLKQVSMAARIVATGNRFKRQRKQHRRRVYLDPTIKDKPAELEPGDIAVFSPKIGDWLNEEKDLLSVYQSEIDLVFKLPKQKTSGVTA